MATSSKRSNFRHQLVLFYLVVFLIFGLLIFIFQQYRERTYRYNSIEHLMSHYTDVIRNKGLESVAILNDELRITLINSDGDVVFDNKCDTIERLDNQLQKTEMKQLQKHSDGNGSAIRLSEFSGIDEFFYVTAVDGEYLRVAIPYDNNLRAELTNDTIFLSFFVLIFILLLLVVIYYSNKFGDGISNLYILVSELERGRYVELKFPNNELGIISEKILNSYNLIKESKKNLRRERNRLVESIAISKKLKYEMTGNIAHELKTPVATIRGYVETLINNDVSPERSAQFLNRCNEQVMRLTELIDDISLITKIEDAPTMFKKETVNLYDIVSEVVYDLTDKLSEVDDLVENALNENLFIMGNRNLIYSIFRNLVENSIRYAGRGVLISVSILSESDEFVKLSYSDNGAGVSQEHYSRIFERFYRVDFGRARNDGGSGLGLSIVKNAVAMHNGKVSANTAEDGGLEFKITLAKGV